MPYKGDDQTISMYVLLPENIEDLLEKLTPEILDDIFNGVYFGVGDVVLIFPTKLSFEKEADLIPVCLKVPRAKFKITAPFKSLKNTTFSFQ